MSSTRYNTPKILSIPKCMTKEARKERNARFYQTHKEQRKYENEKNKVSLILYYKKRLGTDIIADILAQNESNTALDAIKHMAKENKQSNIKQNFKVLPFLNL